MKWIMTSLAVPTALAGLALTGAPAGTKAQVAVDVHVSWHWSSDGWSSQPVRRAPRDAYYYAPAPRPSPYAAPLPALRIPPGHMPPPGACRLWYVGRPPGHQPPPTSCARLFRSYHGYGQPGVVILQGAPLHRGAWTPYGGYGYEDGPGFRGPGQKGRRGKGPKGRGRGGG